MMKILSLFLLPLASSAFSPLQTGSRSIVQNAISSAWRMDDPAPEVGLSPRVTRIGSALGYS